MKHLLYSLSATLFISFGFSACGNKAKPSDDKDKAEVVDKTGKEYTSAYICPMHCKNSGSDKVGTCSVCGMDYVVNKDHKHDGHNHSEHDGHNHGNHDGHDHGSHDGHDHGSHDGHDHGSHEGHNH